MKNYCLGILYRSMSLYLVIIMDIVQKKLVYCRKLHVFTGFTFIVLFGIVELCML